MKQRNLIMLLLSIIAVMQTAQASVTYTYTGHNFDSFYSSDGQFQPFTTADHISFSFTTDTALAPNTVVGDFTMPLLGMMLPPSPLITGWGYSDGKRSVTSSDTSGFTQYFDVATDAYGNISQWLIVTPGTNNGAEQFGGQLLSPYVSAIDAARTPIHDYAFYSQEHILPIGTIGALPYAMAGSSIAGSWSVSLTAVPLPAGFWLMGSTLLGYFKIGRHKSSRLPTCFS